MLDTDVLDTQVLDLAGKRLSRVADVLLEKRALVRSRPGVGSHLVRALDTDEAFRGLVVATMPATHGAILIATATVLATLAFSLG